jgi:DNA-binding NtrC family response regulator
MALAYGCCHSLLSPPTQRSGLTSWRKERILWNAERGVNQPLAVRVLEKHGGTVVMASNGQEVLAALTREPFDVVLMDVRRALDRDGHGPLQHCCAAPSGWKVLELGWPVGVHLCP